ncbi:hypothetical protein Q75_15540 [Bacillus coahuilensis p1.1.43]|uniref:HTH cro/C1-type domain-containing protein n=1 Tax=Bacillus coahuilensis p1.1.43 TaxID=1150625 RepID=A0A147K4N8_9BACI|nr:tetratricopeptide repeat protein [Bacillus coahuilensis]KUP04407.1 hypothetical protein Q75_15540 [Bacillus coahuilensis p1.1.43]
MNQPDFSQIGQVIRELREALGLHQQDLCKGICTQSQLSKIENGISLPQSTTLYMISKRLGIDVNTLFEYTTTSRMDYVLEVEALIRGYVRKKDYKSIREVVLREKQSPIFYKNHYNLQLLLWHEAISIYYVDQDSERSLMVLDEALNLTRSTSSYYNERELAVINSMAVIHFESGNYEEAVEIYREALTAISQVPKDLYSDKIRIRLYYNLAKTLFRLENYSGSIEICQKAVCLCIRDETFYLLGELNYYIGFNYVKLENNLLAKEYLEKAKGIFVLTENHDYITYVDQLVK